METQIGAQSTSELRFQRGKYTFSSFFQLFLICVFPIHIWAILTALSDFSWVAERTKVWDAVGLISYALIYALMETIAVFTVICILGLFTPKRWEVERRALLLGTLFLVTSTWAILGQLYSFWGGTLPESLLDLLVRTGHPIRIVWGVVLPLIFLSAAIPSIAVVTRDRVKDVIASVFERISVLSAFYLLLDIVGIIIIFIRSITE